MVVTYSGVSYPVPIAEPLQQRDPAGLHPVFRRLLEAYLEAAQPYSPHVLKLGECRRSLERQVWLYSLGRAQPGRVATWTLESRHRVGLACDLYAVDADGKAVWDGDFWAGLYKLVPPEWFGLKSLAPKEFVHLEHGYADALIARADEFGLEQS